MIIDFNSIETAHMLNFRGGEKTTQAKMFADDLNRIMHGTLEPGASIGLHTHDAGCEILYVLQGTGTVLYNGEEKSITAGQCHYCAKGNTHSLINNSAEDLIFFAVIPNQ